jgi:hypothetical protein
MPGLMKRLVLLALVVCASVHAAESISPPQVVRILNKGSGKYITVGASTTE